MPWPVPDPGVIADRMSAGFEDAYRYDEAGLALPETVDARSPNSPFRVMAVSGGESHFELYLYQRYLADELMPDTAEDQLARHGDIWGVPRGGALAAVGTLVIADAPGTVLPAGIEVADGSGVRWATTVAAVVPAGGSAEVPAAAELAGAAGNVAPGATLGFVSPVPGVAALTATVGAQGILGGVEQQSVASWRADILARIKDPPAGGKASDWARWARAAGAAYVGVYPAWGGAGTVGVVCAMPGPAVPTDAELARIAARLELERPVTAQAVAVKAQLLAVPVTLRVVPDTAAVRASVAAALAAFFAVEADIGRTLDLSRLREAVSSASGEYSHRMVLPADDVVPQRQQLPVLGGVNFVAGA